MYRVIYAFTDLQDGNAVYHTGDIYPRRGASASDERIAELASSANKLGFPLIAPVHEIDPDGEPTLESHEKPVSQASNSQGGVLPDKHQQAARTPKKPRSKGNAKR